MSNSLSIEVIASIAEVDAQVWDRLAVASSQGRAGAPARLGNPFVSHAFLSALDDSNSACGRTGWFPRHLVLRREDGGIAGVAPLYLKNHSQGEYVFDHGWADAFARAGGQYYPKLQCSAPFTPATGPRLLTEGGEDRDLCRLALLAGMEQLAERTGASAAHITFMTEAEWDLAGSRGFLQRTDRQFHWSNEGYASFEDFLAALASRKRKNIRKERETALARTGIEVEWLTGTQLTEAVWDRFFEFYMDTGSRKWGRPYLTRRFYSLAGERMGDRIVLMMARRNGRHIAGAINFIGDDCLYGRHWGCVEDHPCLHFELCYYQAMEYAIAHGLSRVEAGAQGEHKLARGYSPVITRSAHYITHPGLRLAVADYLERERSRVELEAQLLAEHLPFKRGDG